MKSRFHTWKITVLVVTIIAVVSSAPAQRSVASDITLDELDGSVTKLSQYLRSGPVYLTFWALWCEPCKQELRALKNLYGEDGEKPFTILAINMDSPKSIAKVKAYAKSQRYPFPVVLDPNSQIFQVFNGQNLPFAVLLDRSGKVVSTRTGYYPGDEAEIENEIMKLVR